MSRRTVRVDVPDNKPEDLLNLAGKAIAWHEDVANNSKLDPAKMAALKDAYTKAKAQHDAGRTFDAQAQAANQKRNGYLGINHTPLPSDATTTVLKGVTYVRDASLIELDGNEEAMTKQGFNVVVGTAKAPQKKTTPA